SAAAHGSPSVLQSVVGLQQSESGGFRPPDTQVAAGPGHVIEVVNLTFRIWDKSNLHVIATIDLGAFLQVDDSVLSDPKIRFDPQSGRWFMAVISFPTPRGAWYIAVSDDSNPLGTWFVYAIPSAPGTYPDFTAMGISDDKVVLSGNAFDPATAT